MITKYNIKSETDWRQLKENNNADTILFKYSPRCGISFNIERKLLTWLDGLTNDKNLNYTRIDVITSHLLSRQIADELNIRHESPQLIWISNEGKVKWHGSHYAISENELNSILGS
jgi:bacillithiol system protein YtxJ